MINFSRSTMTCVKLWASKEASASFDAHLFGDDMLTTSSPNKWPCGKIKWHNPEGTVLPFIFSVVTTSQICILSIFFFFMLPTFRSLKLVTDHSKSWDKFLQLTMFGLKTKKAGDYKIKPLFPHVRQGGKVSIGDPKGIQVKCYNALEGKCLIQFQLLNVVLFWQITEESVCTRNFISMKLVRA